MMWIVAGFATPGEALVAARAAGVGLAVLVVAHLAAVVALGAPSPVWPATTAWIGTVAPPPVLAAAAAPAGLLTPVDAGSLGATGAAILAGAFFALAAWAVWEAGRLAGMVVAAVAVLEVWRTVAETRSVLALGLQPDAVLILRIAVGAVFVLAALAALRGSLGADDRLD